LGCGDAINSPGRSSTVGGATLSRSGGLLGGGGIPAGERIRALPGCVRGVTRQTRPLLRGASRGTWSPVQRGVEKPSSLSSGSAFQPPGGPHLGRCCPRVVEEVLPHMAIVFQLSTHLRPLFQRSAIDLDAIRQGTPDLRVHELPHRRVETKSRPAVLDEEVPQFTRATPTCRDTGLGGQGRRKNSPARHRWRHRRRRLTREVCHDPGRQFCFDPDGRQTLPAAKIDQFPFQPVPGLKFPSRQLVGQSRALAIHGGAERHGLQPAVVRERGKMAKEWAGQSPGGLLEVTQTRHPGGEESPWPGSSGGIPGRVHEKGQLAKARKLAPVEAAGIEPAS